MNVKYCLKKKRLFWRRQTKNTIHGDVLEMQSYIKSNILIQINFVSLLEK